MSHAPSDPDLVAGSIVPADAPEDPTRETIARIRSIYVNPTGKGRVVDSAFLVRELADRLVDYFRPMPGKPFAFRGSQVEFDAAVAETKRRRRAGTYPKAPKIIRPETETPDPETPNPDEGNDR